MRQSWKPGSFSLVLIILQLSLLLVFFLDIPVARQVIGFLFLTFLPGYALLRLFKFEFGKVSIVLFSMGLSLVFLMISSFFTNLIFTSIGVSGPLAPIPLLIIVNLACNFSRSRRVEDKFEHQVSQVS